MGNIDSKFEFWTKKLYDISKRNYMINFQGQRSRSLKITSPDMYKLYDSLVFKDLSLSFKRAVTADSNFFVYALNSLINSLGNNIIFCEGDLDSQTQNNRSPYYILRNIKKTANFFKQEQGIDVMYVTFAYVKWVPSNSVDEYITPLINVPVTLEQDNIYSLYRLKKQGDLELNPIFLYMLEQQGITLPPINDKSLKEYLKSLEPLFEQLGYDLIEQATLCCLFFQKMVMFKDLMNNKERILNHNIIKALADDNLNYTYNTKVEEASNIKESQRILVIDADSSQCQAINMANAGASFILQGPPGTGKSQTITNIIASSIAQGKKILFVSQKTAALEVVYNMLSKIKLNDFVLALHDNYKLNKNEIINEIYRPYTLQKYKVNEEKINDLQKIDEIIQYLANYETYLNSNVYSLNFTLYELINKYFSINAPVIKDIKINFDIKKITYNDISQSVFDLETFEEQFKDYYTNIDSCYDYCVISDLSLALKDQLEEKLTLTYNNLKSLLAEVNKLKNILGDLPLTLENYENILNNLQEVVALNYDNISLFDKKNLQIDTQSLNEIINLKEKLNQSEIIIKKLFIEKIKDIDFSNIITKLEHKLNEISNIKEFNNKNHFEILSKIPTYLNTLTNNVTNFNSHQEALNYLTTSLKITKETLLSYDLYNIYEELENNSYSLNYFSLDFNNYEIIIEKLGKLQELSEQEGHLKELIGSMSSLAILNLSAQEVQDYINILDEKTNWFDFEIKGQKKEVINNISTYLKEKNDVCNIVRILNLVVKYQEIKENINFNKNILKPLVKNLIDLDSFDLDYKKISQELSKAHRLIFLMPNVLVNTLKANLSFAFKEQLKENIKILLQTQNVTLNTSNATQEIKQLNETMSLYNQIKPYFKNEQSMIDLENYYNDLIDYKNIKQTYEIKSKTINETYKINGDDLNYLVSQLKDVNVFYNFTFKYQVSEVLLIQAIKDNKLQLLNIINNLKIKFKESFNYYLDFKALFTVEKHLENYYLEEIVTLVNKCLENIPSLKNKTNFEKNIKQYQENIYLKDFINYFLDKQMIANFKDLYLKRLYGYLIESYIYDTPCLEEFNKAKIIAKIKELEQLSFSQMKYSRYIVNSNWLNSIPSLNTMMPSDDERNFLQNERKKARKKSLRIIFERIPHILMALKPCLMMSPLTVANYLENDNYDFDLVIFDEASQIKPEEAIGSIYRGKQVIIVGDSKQLPPTNFFEKQVEIDDDYNDDDSDSDDLIDESILDLAIKKLPSITLLWHYRSKVESLIAFSNKHFYDNALITFPSVKQNQDNFGLQYLKVNGVYQKNSPIANVIEAQKVVSLIYEHILNNQSRSLGVIAFGERQKNTIEKELLSYRKKLKTTNEELFKETEEFFTNKVAEPFFIKNIENVQGDERDTIIFSIGYGPDENNIFRYNFGPLSKQGGKRRLNVAISRAKYNLKIVASFYPEELDLNRIESEGGQLFKNYLEYAYKATLNYQNNSLNQRLLADNEGIKVSIRDFLIENGYNCLLDYGASNFKIDIAVADPSNKNNFMCAILLDNQKEDMSIKDKEVVISKVLKLSDWKVYHVYAKTYFENPSLENENILNFLHEQVKDEFISYDFKDVDETKDLILIEDEENSSTPSYNFTKYETFDFNEYLANIGWLQKMLFWKIDTNIVKAFLKKEGPTLFKTLVDKFINGLNVTRFEITGNLQKIIMQDDFIWERKTTTFVYLKEDNPCIVRQCFNDLTRNLENIYPLEINNCMMSIIRSSVGLTVDGLINEVMRIYNQKIRSLTLIKKYKVYIERLKSDKKIQEIDGILTIYKGADSNE